MRLRHPHAHHVFAARDLGLLLAASPVPAPLLDYYPSE